MFWRRSYWRSWFLGIDWSCSESVASGLEHFGLDLRWPQRTTAHLELNIFYSACFLPWNEEDWRVAPSQVLTRWPLRSTTNLLYPSSSKADGQNELQRCLLHTGPLVEFSFPSTLGPKSQDDWKPLKVAQLAQRQTTEVFSVFGGPVAKAKNIDSLTTAESSFVCNVLSCDLWFWRQLHWTSLKGATCRPFFLTHYCRPRWLVEICGRSTYNVN